MHNIKANWLFLGALILLFCGPSLIVCISKLFKINLPIPFYIFLLILALKEKAIIIGPICYLLFSSIFGLFNIVGKATLCACIITIMANFYFIFHKMASNYYEEVTIMLYIIINITLTILVIILSLLSIKKKEIHLEYISCIIFFVLISTFAFPIIIKPS